jgi:isoquinoline 1-oxidoreductase beta subunit
MLSWEHQVAAAEMDLRHGYGAALQLPDASHPAIEQAAFNATVSVPYEFGITQQRITNQRFEVPTGSWRAIYSGFTMAANEIFVDRLAQARGEDDIQFRLDHLAISTSASAPAATRCLVKVQATRNAWGPAPAGHAYGVAMHAEYRSAVAYLVEIDATNPRRPAPRARVRGGRRGVPINRKGLEAQIQGVLIDGWSVMISAANHLANGAIVEGSYSDFHWARMNHAPHSSRYVFSGHAREQARGLRPAAPASSASARDRRHA